MNNHRLRRDLGLLEAIAVGWGAIIGAGIFVVIGLAAGVAGSGFLLGLVLAAIVAAFNALSSAQLAAKYPTSGGTYEYGYELVHPVAGFAAGWMFLASKLAAGGTVAIGLGAYVSRYFPLVPPVGASLAAVFLLALANLLGIRKAGRLNLAIVAVTLLALVVFAFRAAPAVDFVHLRLPEDLKVGELLRSAALLFFAYTGYARLATLAEEVRDPGRTIPRAIIFSLGSATLLYLVVASVATGVVGAPALAQSDAPLATAAKEANASFAESAVLVGAATAMLGVLLSQILGISRMMLAMARRGDLPSWLGHVDKGRGTPDVAIVVTTTVIAALAVIGTLAWVVAAASFTILLYYAITNIAALRLDAEGRLYPRWIAWLGLLSCLGLAASLDRRTIAAGCMLLAVGLTLRFLWHRLGSRSS
ncbi:MAG TPA: APC family permease [Fimbriimonadaceae bacterium]|nr:APC family permease [Fimbriimonadaceae bacterium]